jgi:hypothetical protein
VNWKKLLWNLAASAAAGAATAFASGAQTGNISGKAIAVGVCAPIVTNIAGLFQQAPHTEGE